jgi:hypothetical protein
MRDKTLSCKGCGCGIGTDQYGSPYSLTHKYNEFVCKMSDGTLRRISCCSKCEIEPGFIDGDSEVVFVGGKKGLQDVLKYVQDSKCAGCGGLIEATWIITNGLMFHEGGCTAKRGSDALGEPASQEVER